MAKQVRNNVKLSIQGSTDAKEHGKRVSQRSLVRYKERVGHKQLLRCVDCNNNNVHTSIAPISQGVRAQRRTYKIVKRNHKPGQARFIIEEWYIHTFNLGMYLTMLNR